MIFSILFLNLTESFKPKYQICLFCAFGHNLLLYNILFTGFRLILSCLATDGKALKHKVLESGKRKPLRAPSPLRTVRDSFPSYGSSNLNPYFRAAVINRFYGFYSILYFPPKSNYYSP